MPGNSSNVADDVRNMSLAEVVDTYGEIEATIKALDKRKKELADAIKGAVRNNTGTFAGARYAVTVTQVAGRKTLDKDAVSAALRVAGLDPENYMKEGAPTMRIAASKLG